MGVLKVVVSVSMRGNPLLSLFLSCVGPISQIVSFRLLSDLFVKCVSVPAKAELISYNWFGLPNLDC